MSDKYSPVSDLKSLKVTLTKGSNVVPGMIYVPYYGYHPSPTAIQPSKLNPDAQKILAQRIEKIKKDNSDSSNAEETSDDSDTWSAITTDDGYSDSETDTKDSDDLDGSDKMNYCVTTSDSIEKNSYLASVQRLNPVSSIKDPPKTYPSLNSPQAIKNIQKYLPVIRRAIILNRSRKHAVQSIPSFRHLINPYKSLRNRLEDSLFDLDESINDFIQEQRVSIQEYNLKDNKHRAEDYRYLLECRNLISGLSKAVFMRDFRLVKKKYQFLFSKFTALEENRSSNGFDLFDNDRYFP